MEKNLTRTLSTKLLFLLFVLGSTLTACHSTQQSTTDNPTYEHPLLQASVSQSDYFNPTEEEFDPASFQQAQMDVAAFQRSLPYPLQALQDRAQGRMLLNLFVDETGSIEKVVILKSVHSSIDLAVLNKLSSQQITPAQKDGQPVASQLLLPLHFQFSVEKVESFQE